MPPIQFFSGKDPAVTVDDWLPSLEPASAWNGWSVTEKLMQLPGYLKGRTLQEWSLLGPTVQQDYTAAIDALRSRLDSTNRTMAAQDFRHSIQRQGESVADFIRRLEKSYRELCVVAKGEEHRLTALQQRHQLKPPSEPLNRPKKTDAEQTRLQIEPRDYFAKHPGANDPEHDVRDPGDLLQLWETWPFGTELSSKEAEEPRSNS